MSLSREQMVSLIKEKAPKELRDEIGHYMTIEEREYPYDEVMAVLDTLVRQEDEDGDKKLLKQARQILIDLGFFRVMPQEEIDNTFRSGRGPVWDFALKGVKYTSDFTYEEWFLED